MSFPNYKYNVGLNNVGSYLVSGKPCVSASIIPASGAAAEPRRFQFPAVTKEITLTHDADSGKHVRVAFSANGVKDQVGRYFLVPPAVDGGTVNLNVKATELYAMAHDGTSDTTLTVYAALTGIPTERVDAHSSLGPNWSGSSGVG